MESLSCTRLKSPTHHRLSYLPAAQDAAQDVVAFFADHEITDVEVKVMIRVPSPASRTSSQKTWKIE